MKPERWESIPLHVTNEPGNRSPSALSAVLDALDVERQERYRPGLGKTFCNLLCWDATRALCAEVPHWVGEAPHRRELNANGMILWLRTEGAHRGWRIVGPAEAREAANVGCPVVATWENTGKGSGHVAMVRPSGDKPLRICQAGAKCFNDAPLTSGFGALPVTFYAHP